MVLIDQYQISFLICLFDLVVRFQIDKLSVIRVCDVFILGRQDVFQGERSRDQHDGVNPKENVAVEGTMILLPLSNSYVFSIRKKQLAL